MDLYGICPIGERSVSTACPGMPPIAGVRMDSPTDRHDEVLGQLASVEFAGRRAGGSTGERSPFLQRAVFCFDQAVSLFPSLRCSSI